MSNSIWKTPDQKPERFRTVIFQSIELEEPELGHWDGQTICPHNEFESLDMSQITRWCYLDDLIAQADKAERLQKQLDTGDLSDGYHTFNDLYYHRMCLFSIIVKQNKSIAWKSKLHSDGTMFDNYFIVGIDTPNGQATYHYHIDHWDMFDCVELPNAPEWDGHTADDVLKRLLTLT